MKDKNTAGVLAIFLGGFGLHKFYLGQPIIGVVYILFCWTFIPAIISFFEGLGYFMCKNNEVFNKKYNSKEVLMEQVLTASLQNNSKPNNLSHLDELKKLKELLDLGAITQDEFDTEKAKLMSHISQSNMNQGVSLESKKSPEKKRKPMSKTFRIIIWVILSFIGLVSATDGSYKVVLAVLVIGILLIPQVNTQLHSMYAKIPKPEITNGAKWVIFITILIGSFPLIGFLSYKDYLKSDLSTSSSLTLPRIQSEDEFTNFIDKKMVDIIKDLKKEGDKVTVKKKETGIAPNIESTQTIITIQRNGYRVQIDSKDFLWDKKNFIYTVIPESKKMPSAITYWFENQTPCILANITKDTNTIAQSIGLAPSSKGDSKENGIITKMGFSEFRNTLGRSDLEFSAVCSEDGVQYYATIYKSYE